MHIMRDFILDHQLDQVRVKQSKTEIVQGNVAFCYEKIIHFTCNHMFFVM